MTTRLAHYAKCEGVKSVSDQRLVTRVGAVDALGLFADVHADGLSGHSLVVR